MKRILTYIWLIVMPVLVSGQEYLTGITGNPEIEAYLKAQKQKPELKSYVLRYSPVRLPFFDNFSEMRVYPDTSRWVDNEAYINSHFAYFPVDCGVATLDVLDARGNLYSNASPFTFVADHLTSRPIRLDAYFNDNGDSVRPLYPSDSVYLSFYYQPQGLGDMPGKNDSLVLEFGSYGTPDTLVHTDTIVMPDTTYLVYDTTLVYDSIFSHFDSVWVYGYNYDSTLIALGTDYIPPGYEILPPPGCDFIPYLLGDTLFKEDSLLIPCDSVYILKNEWEFIWSATGDTLATFIDENNTFFKYVKIPVTDSAWFRKDFRFRFKNYGTISAINSWQSNTDHWHLDRVYLDKNRTAGDRFSREISFIQDPPTLLNDYTSLPANQYLGNISAFKRDELPVFVSNLDSVQHNVSYDFQVTRNGNILENFEINPVNKGILPLTEQDVDNFAPFDSIPLHGAFTSASDSSVYIVTHTIHDTDSAEVADTLITAQIFSDYMSYDDGTAEAGYGLTPANARLAVRFTPQVEDTLWGVRMYFNKTLANNNNHLFHLTVWNDNGGIPGDTIYQEKNVRPQFTNGLNNFYDLIFTDFVRFGRVPFYVGWWQTTNHNLNIGFDRNTNSSDRIFYNVDGSWVQSSFEGSIMIRPILNKPGDFNSNQESKKTTHKNLLVKPNPVRKANEVYIELPEGYEDPRLMQFLNLKVSNLHGRVMYNGPYTETLSTAGFDNGFYIITLFDNAYNRHFSAKLVIVK